MAQNLPPKIGKYEVLEVLGQGGMGTVYKAVDPLIGRLVAIKVIVANYIDNPELLKRFYREAKAVGNLQHPNIVTVYDLGEENKNPYLVMQYLDGEPLNKIIAERRELPLLQKLTIIARVCDALFYAHQRDIVHRDVKPANVLLLKDGQIKLLDFGIARLGNSGYNQTETRKGQVMGTMSYMSPEQLNEEVVDGRSDVYSTGVMLFELMTSSLPFEASDLGSLIAKKMTGTPPPPLSKYLDTYPPELDEILARALAKDRDDRHNTAQDLAFDLERLIERLKRDMVSDFVERARECISSAELGRAKDLLSEVLKIDTQHTAAKQLLYEVQQSIQKQQRLEHIRQLQQLAREAIIQKQFDDAIRFVDQAIKLDPTDPDSLNLREHIQQAKQTALQVKKLLHLAEVAQQTGELGVFQRAVADALELDPDDPQARVLQASLIRLQAEQEKEGEIQELLSAARRDIAARKFDDAQTHLLKAEGLDPQRDDIPALKQLVLAGHQQEARTRQLQQFCQEVQRELEANNLRLARDLADRALRAFPGEPALLRMKSASESQLEAEQRRKYIEEQIASASRWLELSEPGKALLIVQEASRQFPTDTRLRDFLQMVRQAVQEDAIKRGQLALLSQARDEMQRKRFEDAIEILEAGQIKYPDLRDIADLLSLARKEQELLVKKKKVADIIERTRTLLTRSAFGEALALLEKGMVEIPDPGLEQLLQTVRTQSAEFDADLDTLKKETNALLDSRCSAEALRTMRLQAVRFGQSSEFKALLQQVEQRVTEEREIRQQVSRVLDEARLYLRRGSLHEAESALAECRAKAPDDAGVVAFESQLLEAKAAIERERKRQPPPIQEPPPQQQEPKTSAAAATVMFKPSPAVAELTPPVGVSVSPPAVDPSVSDGGTQTLDRDAATRLFTPSVEAASREAAQAKVADKPAEVAESRIDGGTQTLGRDAATRLFTPSVEAASREAAQAQVTETPAEPAESRIDGGTQTLDRDAATRLFTPSLEAPSREPAQAKVSETPTEPSESRVESRPARPLPLPPEARDSPKTYKTRLIGAGGIVLFLAIAAAVYQYKAHSGAGETVGLVVETSPSGASVRVGSQSCTTPCTLKLKRGTYEIAADLSGFGPEKKSIDLQKDMTAQLDLSRLPGPGPTPPPSKPDTGNPAVEATETASPATKKGLEAAPDRNPPPQPEVKGTLEVRAGTDNAKVIVDGKRVGVTTKAGLYKTEVSLGTHSVTVEKVGFENPVPKSIPVADKGRAQAVFVLKPIPAPPIQLANQSSSTTSAVQPPTILTTPPQPKLSETAKLPAPPAVSTSSTAAASQPPTPVPTSSPTSSVSKQSSAEAVSRVVVRYKALYDHPDVDQLHALWPTISQNDLKKWENFGKLRTDAVDFRPEQPKVNGDSATVRCHLSIHIVGQGKSTATELEIHLKNRAGTAGEDWVIESVQ